MTRSSRSSTISLRTPASARRAPCAHCARRLAWQRQEHALSPRLPAPPSQRRARADRAMYDVCDVDVGLDQARVDRLARRALIARIRRNRAPRIEVLLWGDDRPPVSAHESEGPPVPCAPPDVIVQRGRRAPRSSGISSSPWNCSSLGVRSSSRSIAWTTRARAACTSVHVCFAAAGVPFCR